MAELYDVVAANQRATQIGASMGAQMFGNALRMQQLQSEQALQRLQQQHLAQQMSLAMEQHNMQVQQQADMTKAVARVQLESMPFIPAPHGDEDMGRMIGPDGMPMGEAGQIPNPAYTPLDQSLMRNVLPVIAKYRPQEADNFIASVAMLPYRQAEAKLKEEEARQLSSPGGSGPGTVQQATGNYPGAPTLDVFVPPKGRGAVQLVGGGNLVTKVGDDGRTYELGKDGVWKPLAATPEQQAKARSTSAALNEGLKIDASQVTRNEDGSYTIKPDAWASIQKQAQITPALRTKLMDQLAQSRQSISALDDMIATLRPEDVGARGVVGSELLDVWLPQLGIDSAEVARMDNRTKLEALSEGMLHQMTQDTRFSNTDRADIKGILPKAGMAESYPRAIQTGNTLKQLFAKRSLITADTLGKPTPTWAIGAMTKPKIIEATKAGLVDRQALLDAVALGKLSAPEAVALEAQLPKTP